MRSIRVLAGFLAIVVVGLAWFEISMQPSGAERTQLFALFAALAMTIPYLIVAHLLGPEFPSLLERFFTGYLMSSISACSIISTRS